MSNEKYLKIEFIKSYIQNNEYDCDYNITEELANEELVDEDFINRIMNDLDIVQDYENSFRR